ncbi:MAG TPA: tyrosine-type recombinase/integrase [Gemmataceae bacterium]|nr:tyrosine-type recombinase/integrase [Gemmataceae bacterium]
MPNSIRSIIMDYDAHLREVAGLAPATRSYRRRYACEFLRSVFGSGPVRWSRLRAEHLQDFVSSYGRTGRWAAAQVSACALRNFLRWLQFCGRTGPELIAIVPHIPRWRLAALPPVLSGNQVATLLGTFDRSTHVGRRDFAMAVCMVELGLRVSEVAGLKLEHVDLATTTVRLVGGKSRRNRILPMPRRVYQAILNYIRDGRPLTTDAHLFVRHRLPVGLAVSRELVRGVIRRAYATVPGCGPLTGTHILRHTAATRLLGAGADLKRIADILGHKSIDTTAIYAKVDMAHLTAVAAPWPTTDKEVGP